MHFCNCFELCELYQTCAVIKSCFFFLLSDMKEADSQVTDNDLPIDCTLDSQQHYDDDDDMMMISDDDNCVLRKSMAKNK